jgi:hypothetical protein
MIETKKVAGSGTLGESHDKDEVNGDESEQVGRRHSVYHDNEGSGGLEGPIKVFK